MLDKAKIAKLHTELQAVINKFAAENDMIAGGFNIKYNESEFKTSALTFASKTSNPDATDPRFMIDLKRRGWQEGLTVEMVGREAVLPSRQGLVKFKFLGMRASKAVFKSSVDGKNYLFPANTAARYLKDVK